MLLLCFHEWLLAAGMSVELFLPNVKNVVTKIDKPDNDENETLSTRVGSWFTIRWEPRECTSDKGGKQLTGLYCLLSGLWTDTLGRCHGDYAGHRLWGCLCAPEPWALRWVGAKSR